MKKPVVICVDDERIVLNGLREQLKTKIGSAFIIETAENGDEAIELLGELKEAGAEIPLIISDYIMPGMKGDELLIKVHEDHPKMIKILLTGQATLDGVTRAINKANLYRYISKPWEKEDLNLAINEAIKSYEKDKQIEEQNRKLKEHNEELLAWSSSFVEAMGTALDTRDTTTGGHSKRLAGYAVKTAEAINRINYGKYKDFQFTEDEIKELYYAALLHDIGKIGVREHVLLKQYRLSEERQLAIQYRFEWYKSQLNFKMKSQEIDSQEKEILNKLSEYLSFVMDISKRDFISNEEAEKIKEIAEIQFVDIDGKQKNLLDEFEVTNLTVKKGNLTEEERNIINSHVEHTYNILKGIPWTQNFSRVPEIAASHHEKLNGSGYYRGLSGEEISVQSRILAILDIFEALTAPDRPYKAPKSVEETIKILEFEVNAGNLDKDILEIFIKERIFE